MKRITHPLKVTDKMASEVMLICGIIHDLIEIMPDDRRTAKLKLAEKRLELFIADLQKIRHSQKGW